MDTITVSGMTRQADAEQGLEVGLFARDPNGEAKPVRGWHCRWEGQERWLALNLHNVCEVTAFEAAVEFRKRYEAAERAVHLAEALSA